MLAIALTTPAFARDTAQPFWWLAAGVLAAVMFAAWWTADRSPELSWLSLPAALLAFPVVLLLELADPRDATAFAPLLILPVVWCALYHRAAHLAVVNLLAAITLFLPILLIGAPGYPPSTWRRSVLWLVVLLLIAPAVQTILRSTQRAAQQIVATEHRYRSAFADAPVAIAIIGSEPAERGRILLANAPLHELLGCAVGGLVGADILDYTHPDDSAAFAHELNIAVLGETRHIELRLNQISARERWVSAWLALTRHAASEPPRFVCHFEDITVRRESEHALLEALEQQGAASNQIREAIRSRSDLVAMVSHDVRNPLSTIGAYVELLQMGEGGDLTPDQRMMLDVIAANVRRAYAITDDLVTLDGIENAPDPAPREPVTIGEVLAQVVRSAEPSARARHQRITLDSTLDDIQVAGHAVQLDRVISNLVTNAIKFTPEGGSVKVRGRLEGGTVVVQVIDTGSGIAPEDHERIFERFYRSDGARLRRVAGTGLGLAIVREIATLHGGTITVASVVDRGSTFTLTLPAMVVAA
ncbi:MAG TPA: ATP-binding protein [Jatrophihabitans sp.]|uniref:ATP-binding protein n=1 Tax=Jatrophihabitans sp. TaxID=1932789 RepID=UPI002E052840|nr:ATP-binding protein [Jatrophihabitans sp.]